MISHKLKQSKTKMPRWTKNCKAAKLLRQGLRDGSIQRSEAPKDVWKRNSAFKAYELAQFRSNFNRIKQDRNIDDAINGFDGEYNKYKLHFILISII